MAWDFGAILKGVEAAIPVAQKAITTFKKKPKEVQQVIIERIQEREAGVQPSAAPSGSFAGLPILPLIAIGALVFFLRRK